MVCFRLKIPRLICCLILLDVVVCVLFLSLVGITKEFEEPQKDPEIPKEWSHVNLSTRLESRMYSGIRYVLTTYYFNASSKFYMSREIPSLDWIEVFLMSLYTVSKGSSREMKLKHLDYKTKVIFFMDPETFNALWKKRKVREMVSSGFLFIILIAHPDYAYTLNLTNGNLKHSCDIWSLSFVSAKWITGLRNGANNFRFALYLEWLRRYVRYHQKHGQLERATSVLRHSRFLLSDSSDVAFQTDPFRDGSSCFPSVSDPFVVFTLESSSKNFRNEKYNRNWMSCYGSSVLNYLSKGYERISCAGIIFGNGFGLMYYLESLIDELENPKLQKCSLLMNAALDQASHNYLLHIKKERQKYNKIMISQEKTACVFHGNFGKLTLNDLGSAVVRGTNISYAIIHQYTAGRVPYMMKRMRALFGSHNS